MRRTSLIVSILLLTLPLRVGTPQAQAQEIPHDYQQVLKIVGKSGDYKAKVLKVNIPRNDIQVNINGLGLPTPFGFGGWFAMTKGAGGDEVLMGDLVLLQEEVNPVMSALLDKGLEVTALHNHFFWETPRIYYMHVHGHGKATDLAERIKPALAMIATGKEQTAPNLAASPSAKTTLDTSAIAKIVGHEGEQSGAIYKITLGATISRFKKWVPLLMRAWA